MATEKEDGPLPTLRICLRDNWHAKLVGDDILIFAPPQEEGKPPIKAPKGHRSYRINSDVILVPRTAGGKRRGVQRRVVRES